MSIRGEEIDKNQAKAEQEPIGSLHFTMRKLLAWSERIFECRAVHCRNRLDVLVELGWGFEGHSFANNNISYIRHKPYLIYCNLSPRN